MDEETVGKARTRLQEALRHKVAAREHEQWAGWMHYLFSKCTFDDQGQAVIPRELAERWNRQMLTVFADLSYQEKQSDYAEADKVLLLFSEHIGNMIDWLFDPS